MTAHPDENGRAPLTAEQAKRQLLLFGEAESVRFELRMEKVKSEVRQLLPLVAGGAALLGLFTGRRGWRASKAREADGPRTVRSTAGQALRWGVRFAVPFVARAISRGRKGRAS